MTERDDIAIASVMQFKNPRRLDKDAGVFYISAELLISICLFTVRKEVIGEPAVSRARAYELVNASR